MPICEPDPNTNDAECNPCENNGNRFCQIAGLPNAFQCCPPTSNCKDTVIPTRLGVPQNSLEVSFVCSRNCGSTCTDIRNSDGESNACALFTPLDLNDDSDPDTDDVLNLCPDVSAD
ncbi:hypothetical protein BWQ96_02370 [Gracilariopsis chorda]|uniref:Uncharacterized protein n=1 Tax=Gracilariopsis chorda TaxID=448386 RepID=A0A2V3J0A6_9FLOR|nr:hypothetical protein BWQ96_02370 [Gracilariopsis chorda]|eukprot:PXF47834.1 hypothetical protein BWQ96_02370 [Gracilariopsis chorda]